MRYKTLIQNLSLLMVGIIVPILLNSCSSAEGGPQQGNASPSVEVMVLDTASATTYKEYSTILEGKVNVEIRPQVAGYLENVLIDEGAYVEAGQVLFRINDRPFREQLNSALGAQHAAEAALTNAQLELDKLTPLVQNKVVSEIQLKAAQAAYQLAKANADQAKAQAAAAQINLDYTQVKAPVSGYVGRFPKKIGSLVSPTDPQSLTLLSDVKEVYAYFSLSENEFLQFKSDNAGTTIEEKVKHTAPVILVLADNSEYPQKGKIDIVTGQFDRNTGAITLRASFPNEQGLLRSGNTGKVRMTRHHDGMFLVPQQSTIELQDKLFVYAVGDSNKVKKKPIIATGKSGTNFLVKEGLNNGTVIVYSGLDRLQEGIVISPRKVSVDSIQNKQISSLNK